MNVLNVHEIEQTLARMSARARYTETKRWVLTVARNYFLAKLPAKDVLTNFRQITTRPTKSVVFHTVKENELPGWAKAALTNDEIVMWFDPIQVSRREFWNVLEIIIHWFNNWKTTDTRLRRVDRIAFPVATQAAILWYKDVSENIWNYVVDKPILVKAYDHGFRWVRMVSALQFEREGRLMNHCVGNGNYFNGWRSSGELEYYSLRDAENTPHVTMQVKFNSSHPLVRQGSVQQCKGNGNQKPAKPYQRYIRQFISDMDWTIIGDGSNID
jgi:hypothetical protein